MYKTCVHTPNVCATIIISSHTPSLGNPIAFVISSHTTSLENPIAFVISSHTPSLENPIVFCHKSKESNKLVFCLAFSSL
jgi:hypothetical protein